MSKTGPQQPEKKKEPLPTNERYRDFALPSGLKNIGNSKFAILVVVFWPCIRVACYFASLIQVMFHLPNITKKIIGFNTTDFDSHFERINSLKQMDSTEKTKMMASREIVKNL